MSASFRSNSLRRQQLLEARAHAMRLSPSEPEARLWRALCSSQLGVRFRRQVVLAGAVVDFFVPAARLVVEVDGAHHLRQRGADRRRDARLAAAGFRAQTTRALCAPSGYGWRWHGPTKAEARPLTCFERSMKSMNSLTIQRRCKNLGRTLLATKARLTL